VDGDAPVILPPPPRPPKPSHTLSGRGLSCTGDGSSWLLGIASSTIGRAGIHRRYPLQSRSLNRSERAQPQRACRTAGAVLCGAVAEPAPILPRWRCAHVIHRCRALTIPVEHVDHFMTGQATPGARIIRRPRHSCTHPAAARCAWRPELPHAVPHPKAAGLQHGVSVPTCF
jgi:hypothetical protein